MSYRQQEFYAPMRPPAPPVQIMRVITHKKPDAETEIFETHGPIDAAIKQVRDAGYPRAMVVIK